MKESALTAEPAAGLLLPLVLGGLGYAGMVVGAHRLLVQADGPSAAPQIAAAADAAPAPVLRVQAPAAGIGAPPPTAPVAPVAPPVRARPSVRDCPPLSAVRFGPGSLRPEELPAAHVSQLQTWLAAHPQALLLVQGHADARGSARYNWELSYRRAQAVALLLRQSGIPRERITARAAGAYQPLAGRSDTEAANRRVVLTILGVPECEGATDPAAEGEVLP